MRILLPGFILLMAPLAAQPISFGAKIGVPATEAFNDNGGKFSYSHSTGRWIVGASVELRLPFGLGVEADALIRRYNIGSSVTEVEFPILAKYRFGLLPLVHPFVDGGPAFNYVTDPGFFLSRPHASSPGAVVGGGIEIRALILRITPEIRFTHWYHQNITLAPLNSGLSSSTNQVEFLVGINF